MLKGDAKKRGQPGKKWLLLPNSHSDCDLKTHEKKSVRQMELFSLLLCINLFADLYLINLINVIIDYRIEKALNGA